MHEIHRRNENSRLERMITETGNGYLGWKTATSRYVVVLSMGQTLVEITIMINL